MFVLCELMPKQAPCDIRLSISRYAGCELRPSLPSELFWWARSLKIYSSYKREKHNLKENVGVSLLLNTVITCYNSSTLSPMTHCTRHGIGTP